METCSRDDSTWSERDFMGLMSEATNVNKKKKAFLPFVSFKKHKHIIDFESKEYSKGMETKNGVTTTVDDDETLDSIKRTFSFSFINFPGEIFSPSFMFISELLYSFAIRKSSS